MRKAGERINLVRKAFNVREGWKRADDTLPPRVFEGGAVTESGLAEMLQGYYGARGWGGEGVPSRESLRGLGLNIPNETPV